MTSFFFYMNNLKLDNTEYSKDTYKLYVFICIWDLSQVDQIWLRHEHIQLAKKLCDASDLCVTRIVTMMYHLEGRHNRVNYLWSSNIKKIKL